MSKFLRFSKSACASKKILILILHLPMKIESETCNNKQPPTNVVSGYIICVIYRLQKVHFGVKGGSLYLITSVPHLWQNSLPAWRGVPHLRQKLATSASDSAGFSTT